MQHLAITLLWLVATINFWHFWLARTTVESPLLYTMMSLALFYESTFLPSMYLFFVGRMRVPESVAAPSGRRVAVITLCVPSKESLAIIERQIRAMAAITYPHDTWLLDEEDDPHVAALCRCHGVRHFSRKGVAEWNRPHPPFQAKTKAGNVNSWLLTHGRDYEFFVQLDIDHNPVPSYLDRVLGHFTDPRVAWVQAPSVYGNLDEWAARGSAEQELVLQGPLQMGFYGFSETPFIIGSHSTYRTGALLEIGGMQPTRAEDHLDTVVLAQHGYVGVFVPEVIATGDGPEDFDTYLGQQFAWAYSMIQVLFQYAPRYMRRYRPRAALQFLFAQTWYTCWSLAMAILFLIPSLMLLTGIPMAQVSLGPFLLYYLPLPIVALAAWFWTRRWFQPSGVGLTWRGMVLHIARWPVVLWAFINVIFRVRRPYMITPKGVRRGQARPFNLAAQGPYIALIAISLAASWWHLAVRPASATQGYLLFALQGAVFMLLVFWLALTHDLRSLRRDALPRRRVLTLRRAPILIVGALTVLTFCTTVAAMPAMLTAATWPGPDSGQTSQAAGSPIPAAGSEPGNYSIAGSVAIALRSWPGFAAPVDTTLAPGTALAATWDVAYVDGHVWRRVQVSTDHAGWLREADTRFVVAPATGSPQESSTAVRVTHHTAARVALLLEPGDNGAMLTPLDADAPLSSTGEVVTIGADIWQRFVTLDGYVGWLCTDNVRAVR